MPKPWPQGPNKKRRALSLAKKLRAAVQEALLFEKEEGHPSETLVEVEAQRWARALGEKLVEQTELKYKQSGSPTYIDGSKR